MRYKIPKFLERETKFFNFFTFKQLILVGGVGLLLVILYYIVPMGLFVPVAILTGGGIFSLLFIKIEGMPLGKRLIQYFGFFFGSNKYIWQRRGRSQPISTKKEKKDEDKDDDEPPLRPGVKSSLNRLSSKIEMGFRE